MNNYDVSYASIFHMCLSSARNGGAHGRYGVGDWSFLRCREYMTNVSSHLLAYLVAYLANFDACRTLYLLIL